MVLIVSEEQTFSDTLNELLQTAGYTSVQIYNFNGLHKTIKAREFDIYFIDSQLFHSDIFDFISKNKLKGSVVIMSSYDESERAAAHNAYFLLKPFKIDDIINVINKIENNETTYAGKAPIQSFEDSPFFITQNKKFKTILQKASDMAFTGDDLIIHGAFGTGKELMARFIHDASGMKNRSFIPVNCSLLSPELMEFEFFGKSSFPGVNDKEGVFTTAYNGTVYINNFDGIPIELQDIIIEKKDIKARLIIGFEESPETLLKGSMISGKVIERIGRHQIALPSLRNHIEDIDLIISLMLAEKNISSNEFHIDSSVLKLLKKYFWPGNIRELENLVERSILLTNGRGIYIDNLPLKIVKFEEGEINMNYSLLDVERKHIINTIIRVKGNKAKAARILGIDRKTLYRRIEKLGIEV